MSFAGGEVIKMKILTNETYLLEISKNELIWLNDIINNAIESGKCNPEFIYAVQFEDEMEYILNNEE